MLDTVPSQIGLDFGYSPDYRIENYFVDSDIPSPLDILLNPTIWNSYFLTISGEKGSGKTHLGHIYANHFSVAYIKATDLNMDMLLTLSKIGCVVDSVEYGDETILFHLLNLVKGAGRQVVFLMHERPSFSNFTLPDLKSRVTQSCNVHLDLPSDTVLQGLLMKNVMDRKLRIESDVMTYLLTRMPRSYNGVFILIENLDILSLQNKVNITIPFVRTVMKKMGMDV